MSNKTYKPSYETSCQRSDGRKIKQHTVLHTIQHAINTVPLMDSGNISQLILAFVPKFYVFHVLIQSHFSHWNDGSDSEPHPYYIHLHMFVSAHDKEHAESIALRFIIGSRYSFSLMCFDHDTTSVL